MRELTCHPPPAAGTLIGGTGKVTHGIYVLKHYGWRWSRNLGSWFRPQSRDRLPNTTAITATAEDLRKLGHTVALEVEETLPPVVAVETDRQERAEARAGSLAGKAARKEAAGETANQRMRSTLAALPPGGEPVKIGHHSEGRHLRAITRAEETMGASVAADQQARDALSTLEIQRAPHFCGRVDRVQSRHRANVLRCIENGPDDVEENAACFAAVGIDGHHVSMVACMQS